MEQQALNLHICPFETRVFCVSILSRWEKTCICLNGSLVKRRLDCLITGFKLHLALEFSRHIPNILFAFLNQLRRQIRSTSSGISIFLSLSKRIKRLCLQFIRRPRNFDKGIIYYFVYTGCPRRKGPNFGRVFLRSNYTDITQNTYIQS